MAVDRRLTSVDEYRPGALLGVTAAALFLFVFVLLPVGTIVMQVFEWDSLRNVVTDDSLKRVLWFTTWQSVLSTASTAIVALPVVWTLSRGRFGGHRAVDALVTMPFVMPTVVVAIALRALLPGADTGLLPIIAAHVLFNVAVFVRVVTPQWSSLDPQIEDAARLLGAAPWSMFRTIVWPHISSAVANASCIVVGFTFTSFGVITILGTPSQRTVEVEIVRRALNFGDIDTAVALSLVQIMVVGAVLMWGSSRSDTTQMISSSDRLDRLSPRARLMLRSITTIVGIAMIAPFVALGLRSVVTPDGLTLSGWTHLFDGSLESIGVNVGDAVVNSLTFAVLSAAISVPLALAISSAATYAPRHARWIEAVSFLPLVTSAVTLGLGVIITFDSSPVEWRSRWWMLPVMHAVIAIPLCVRTLGPALRSVDHRVREAAAVLGSPPLRRWWDVDLRSCRRAVWSAVALSVAVSLGEFGATSFLTRSDTQTLPVAVARLIGHIGDIPQNSAYALATVMMASIIAVMLVARA